MKNDPTGLVTAFLDTLVNKGVLTEKTAKQMVKEANKRGLAGVAELDRELRILHVIHLSPEAQLETLKLLRFLRQYPERIQEVVDAILEGRELPI